MDAQALSGPTSRDRTPRKRMGLRHLLIAVAAAGLLTWAGLSVWNSIDGDPSIRLLRTGAGSATERLAAVGSLHAITNENDLEIAVATLLETLNDRDKEVSAGAARALGSIFHQLIRNPWTTPLSADKLQTLRVTLTTALVATLANPDPEVRAAACVALGVLVKPPYFAPPLELTAALHDGSGSVRWNRKTAISYYGYTDLSAPPELTAALGDPSVLVRRAAMQALAHYAVGMDAAIEPLLSTLDQSDEPTRQVKEQTLERAWPTSAVVPVLIDGLKSRNRAVRFHAAQLLGRIGPEAGAAVPGLTSLIKQPLDPLPVTAPRADFDPYLASPPRAAMIALGRIAPDSTTVNALIEILSQGNPQVAGIPERWAAAAEALHEIGPRARPAAPALIDALNQILDAGKAVHREFYLIDAIGRFAPGTSSSTAAVSVLARLLEPQYRARLNPEYIKVLGKFGSAAQAAIPKLHAIEVDKNPSTPADQASARAAAAAATIAAIEGPSASAADRRSAAAPD